MAFVHLHVHTEYSLLDGFCRIRDLPAAAAALGQTACAITDHGVMYGAIDFYRACKAAGIKPIIGCEVYVAPRGRSRTDRVHGIDSENRHLVLLCENEEGYRNLSYLVSQAWMDGFYIKPRIDQDLLRSHAGGLIALSSCLAGEIPRCLKAGDYAGALSYAREMADLFGPEGFYLELQDHGIPEQQTVNQGILKIHRETGIPMVCTNDAHYLKKEDAQTHDVLLCIQTGKLLEDENRMRYEPRRFYLRSEEEMAALFRDYPGAVENTQRIADRCRVEFTFGQYHLPEFSLPEGYDGASYLKKLCDEGYQARYGSDEAHRRQLRYEQDMIEKMGFTDYFLIVSDFVRYAREAGIPVGPGRGSAAGSMVSYCLGITDVDPVKYGLYFERFLNPERVSMPDIDMDFGDSRRGEVVDYVREKYGDDHVAQIVTFGTLAARGVIRDVGRVMNLPYGEVDTIAKMVPEAQHITLEEALRLSRPLGALYDQQPAVRRLIDTARALEGLPRHASTHAAGVVITRRAVYEYVPLARNDEAVVCQYPMTTLEELGLLKMDFLGLRNLTVLDEAVKLVRRHQPDFSLGEIPEGDEATYRMLSEGRTGGVFQMESAGMTGVCVGLKPQSIEDITAIIALYRPGPMDAIPQFIACKQDPRRITYQHPLLRPILSVTYGCIVYQEQVIQIFQRLGGYSLGQADLVRRAISKKKAGELEREREAFVHGDAARGIAGCAAAGVPEETAQAIFQSIYDFANYAFNKAHAVSYAVVAYQTAYLKCHFPREYMTALLSSNADNKTAAYKTAAYIRECRDCGIALLPPDINASEERFTVEEGGIRFGLEAVKNVGRGLTAAVVRLRQEGGPYRSLADFCARLSGGELNKRALESLIRAGAFDSLGHRRSQLMAVYEAVLEAAGAQQRENVAGQLNFFSLGKEEGDAPPPEAPMPDLPEFSLRERMNMEKEMTGLYLSGHPMDHYAAAVRRAGAVPIAAVLADAAREEGPRRFADGARLTLAGVVSGRKNKTTKHRQMMAYVTLEDESGSIEVLCFHRLLDKSGAFLQEGQAVTVRGRLSLRDEKPPQVMGDAAAVLEEDGGSAPETAVPGAAASPETGGEGTLYLRFSSLEDPAVRHMKLVLGMFPGEGTVRLFMADTRKIYQQKADLAPALIREARETLGEEHVVLRESPSGG